MIYVFDACALISYLHNETGSDIIFELLKKMIDGECAIYMNIVNLIEVHYANIRSLGTEQAAVILEKVLSVPIQIVSDISDTVFQQTARLKASYKCSLADAIGLATAIELSGTFVTADHHELELIVSKETLNLLWFR
jgi:predicted nucleic acid-binding protein